MDKFPFISKSNSLILLRVCVAVIFLSHSIVRTINSTFEIFGGFMESKGFPHGVAWVWGITAYEIIGGLLLAFGYFIKILSAGFVFLLFVGIVLIHASFGWFVGEHGTGGCEYSVILIAALIVLAASDEMR